MVKRTTSYGFSAASARVRGGGPIYLRTRTGAHAAHPHGAEARAEHTRAAAARASGAVPVRGGARDTR